MATVLVIENDILNMHLMRDILGMEDHTVVEASDAASGLRMAIERKPDIILTDIGLPGMNGFCVLEKLKSNKDTASIPVIAVTAFAMPEDKDKALLSGFDAYIAKPIKVEQIHQEIMKFIKK